MGLPGRLLTEQRGGRHLTARHAVDRVVDEDDGDVHAASRRVDDLRHTYGREVAVALIGEDDVVGIGELDARRDRGSSAVGRLLHVAVEVLVSEHGAADGRDADHSALEAEFVDGFGDQSVRYAVSAPRAVMQRGIGEHLGFLEYHCHIMPPCAQGRCTRNPLCLRGS